MRKESSPDLTAYMEVISQRFIPATSENDATHRLSTEEIADAIKALNPGISVSTEHVYDAMIQYGYEFIAVKGYQPLVFKWLLIEK